MAKGIRKPKITIDPIVITEKQSLEYDFVPDLVGKGFSPPKESAMATVQYGGNYARSGYYDRGQLPPTHLTNIEELGLPYLAGDGYVNTRTAILLCQKAYYRLPVFKTAIDMMTDLSNVPLHLIGGNKQSQDFFKAWLRRIRSGHLCEQFFRECFRSGSIIFFRTEGKLSVEKALKINQVYGAEDIDLPIRYILLNPAQICLANFGFAQPMYYRILTRFDLEQLKVSEDPDLNEEYKDIRSEINTYLTQNKEAIIPLDLQRLHTVFYQKQDYEPLAVPMGYCVLDDLNLQLEMKKQDSIILRSVEYAMLLVTMGEAKTEHGGGTNPKVLQSLKDAFSNERIGRVLVSDYTTKAEFVIPDLQKVLNGDKYKEINDNIRNGLGNIFFGEEKFANIALKLKALIKKLENAQRLFLDEFLNPEIKRIARLMNFKSYPLAEFEPIRVEDQTNLLRVYAQLLQFGVLTPKDGMDLFKTGLVPDFEELVDNQTANKQMKDQGLFEPPTGGPFTQQKIADQNAQMKGMPKPSIKSGRPGGSKSPQTTKKVGTSKATEDKFSQKLLVQNMQLQFDSTEAVKSEYKKAKGLKRILPRHKTEIDSFARNLWESELPDFWISKASEYIDKQIELDNEKIYEIESIATEYDVEDNVAIALYYSKL